MKFIAEIQQLKTVSPTAGEKRGTPDVVLREKMHGTQELAGINQNYQWVDASQLIRGSADFGSTAVAI